MIGEFELFNQMLRYGDIQINAPVYGVSHNGSCYVAEKVGAVSKIVITAEGYEFFMDDINIFKDGSIYLKREEADEVAIYLNKFMKYSIPATA